MYKLLSILGSARVDIGVPLVVLSCIVPNIFPSKGPMSITLCRIY